MRNCKEGRGRNIYVNLITNWAQLDLVIEFLVKNRKQGVKGAMIPRDMIFCELILVALFLYDIDH